MTPAQAQKVCWLAMSESYLWCCDNLRRALGRSQSISPTVILGRGLLGAKL